MSRGWLWEDDNWSEFTEFAGDMGEAALDPLQAYVPGVDATIDTVNWAQDPNPEDAIDIFVPEEFEGVVGVAGDYGPGGQNNTSYILPDPPPPTNNPLNTPIPMDPDLDEEPPEEPPTTVFDDAWGNENDEEELDFEYPPANPTVVPPTSSGCCCCCCCPCRCS